MIVSTLFLNGKILFLYDTCSLHSNFINISFQNLVQNDLTLNIFYFTSLTPLNNSIIINGINVNSNHNLFYLSDNTSVILNLGFLQHSHSDIVGQNCIIKSQYVYWDSYCTDCGAFNTGAFLLEANNFQLIVDHSISVGSYFGFFYLTGNNVTFKSFNFSILEFYTYPLISNNVDPNIYSTFELDQMLCMYGDSLPGSFIQTDFASIWDIKNSFIGYVISNEGAGGVFLIMGQGNIFKLDNVTIYSSISLGLGGLLTSIGVNNSFFINNCNISNIYSGVFGNIFGEEDLNINISNSVFCNLSSKVGSFVFSTNSIIFLNNLTFENGETIDEGFINIVYSQLTIIDCNFSSLTAPSGAFAFALYSMIEMQNVGIQYSKCTNSFIVIRSSIVTISSSSFSNIQGGVIIWSENSPIILIINSDFSNIFIDINGFILLQNNNNLKIVSSKFENIKCQSNGAFLNSNNNNNISFFDATLISITSLGKGILFIFTNCQLNIINSFFNNSYSQIAGGVIFASLSNVSIINSIFQNSTSKDGAFVYFIHSYLLFENSVVNISLASGGNSAITAFKSNISIIFSVFANMSQLFSSIDFDYSAISVKNQGYNEYNWIVIQNSTFEFSGLNSNYILFFEGVIDLSVINVILLENNCDCLMISLDSQISVQNIYFVNNTANLIFEITNKILLSNTFVTLLDLSFNKNIITRGLIQIDGNITLDLENFEVNSNQITNMIGSLFLIKNIQKANINHMNCFNNIATSEGIYIIEFSNCINIIICNLMIISNYIQMIKSSSSFLNISSIESRNNYIDTFIYLTDSFIFLQNSIFSGNLIFSARNAINKTIITAFNTVLKLSNTTFNSNQLILPFPQYEIAIFDSYLLSMFEVQFINDVSYSIFARNITNITIYSCRFEITDSNLKNHGTYGIVQIVNPYEQNYSLTISDSQFINLGSNQSISSLQYDNSDSSTSTNIKISNCTFSKNIAYNGGAVTLKGLTQVEIENSFFNENKASFFKSDGITGLGGAIYSICLIPDFCNISIQNSNFQNNQADLLGGGIFLQNYKISHQNATFHENVALLIDVHTNNPNMSSPFYLNVTHFGELTFGQENQTEVFELINGQSVELFFSIFDSDNNPCLYDLSTDLITASGTLTPIDSTITLDEMRVAVEDGQIKFKKFSIQGRFLESYIIQLELEGKFYIKKNFTFVLRECLAGEYYDKTLITCEDCPNGFFSLKIPNNISKTPFQQEGISVCQSCPSNSQCKGSKIVPFTDFWINASNFTTEVIACPISGACFYQDFESFTKPVKCNLGYIGPLCVRCDTGFAKESFLSKCLECHWGAQEFFILAGKLLFMLLFVSYQINTVLFSKFLKESNISAIMIKIIRDHFNQIFLIYSFCNIFQLNDGYFTVYQDINNIITGTELNFDCFFQNHSLDLFFFKIITEMLSPLILQVFVSLSFLVFYFIKKFIMKKKVFISYYLKTIIVAFIVICDTQYTHVLVSFLKLFECVYLDSNNSNTYLRFAPHIQCKSSEHISAALSIGLPCLFVWILGLPIVLFVVVYFLNRKTHSEGDLRSVSQKHRTIMMYNFSGKKIEALDMQASNINELKRNFDESPKLESRSSPSHSPSHLPSFRLKKQKSSEKLKMPGAFEIDLDGSLLLSFLFYDFKGDKYYWTSVILLWKAVISIIVTFINNDSVYIILFSFYIIMFVVYSEGEPYNHKYTMWLVYASFMANTYSIILGQYILTVDEYKNEVILINLVIHLIFFLLATILFIKSAFHEVFQKAVDVLDKKKNTSRFASMILKKMKTFDKYNYIDRKESEINSPVMHDAKLMSERDGEYVMKKTIVTEFGLNIKEFESERNEERRNEETDQKEEIFTLEIPEEEINRNIPKT